MAFFVCRPICGRQRGPPHLPFADRNSFTTEFVDFDGLFGATCLIAAEAD
jgi:hypothetical protein